ncbi:hypothetical protein LSH36_15g18034, partial [Paralvinella palmiformis]
TPRGNDTFPNHPLTLLLSISRIKSRSRYPTSSTVPVSHLRSRLVADNITPDRQNDLFSSLSRMSSLKKFTLEELRKHDGKGPDGKIYVALGGKVYDVTEKGSQFYGKDSPYEKMAGRDASRALASMNLLKVKDGPDDLSDLSELQKEGLKRWVAQFDEKYTVVGTLEK